MTEFKIETKPDDHLYLTLNWADVEQDSFQANMSCGAGMGSTIVQFIYDDEDNHITETFNMADVFEDWINAKRAEAYDKVR